MAEAFRWQVEFGHLYLTNVGLRPYPELTLSNITDIQTIAVEREIRELSRLRIQYGKGRWRKLKGIATVRLIDATIHKAEVHWYEAHGIGKRELKLKFPLID